MIRFLLRKLKQLCRHLANLIFLPVSWILYVCGFRIFGHVHYKAIGHLAVEPDVYIKRTKLGLEKKYKMLLFAPTKRLKENYPEHVVCNKALLDCWRPYFYIFTSPLLWAFSRLKCWNILRYSISNYVMDHKKQSLIYETYKNYKGRSLLSLKKEYINEGKRILKKWKIPENSWFICFHARNNDYNHVEMDKVFSCRNADINSYYHGLEEVTKRGGYCIRIGSKKSKPLDPKFKELNLIDYTKSEDVADWMDLFLLQNCRFFAGGSSGLSHVSTTLGTPCLLVNCIPICHLPFTSHDLTTFKLYYNKKMERYMTLSEIAHSPSAHYLHSLEFENDAIEVISNSEDEIKDAFIEMLDRMDGKKQYTKDQLALQDKFSSLFTTDHFCYGFSSKVSASFLEKYQHLMG